jgi:hypothetical protein
MFHEAKQYLELGYNVLPLKPGAKTPAIEWKERQTRQATLGECAVWFGHGSRNNIGLICGNVVVVDFDTGLPKAREWYMRHKEILKTITLTRRGIHAWFAPSGEEWSGKHADGEIRAKGMGYVVVPNSLVTYDGGSWLYSFLDGHVLVPPAELPPFRSEYVETCGAPMSRRLVRTDIHDVRRYIRGITAIQGKYGSNATIKVAARLRDAGFSEAEALAEMIEWNRTNAKPEWTVQELLKKVRDAFAKGGT